MRRLLLSFLVLQGSAQAQVELPVFGRQDVINGYAKDIEGEVISYFSVYPEYATDALLTRCTDGKKAIAWETAAVPKDLKGDFAYFSWIAAHNSTTNGGDRSFDLFINDQLALTFTTHHSTKPQSWQEDTVGGVSLVFEYSKMDRHGDAHGFAHLRVPRKYITPGQPVQLKVVGHAQNSPDWFMTFRYTFEEKVEVEVLPFIRKSDGKLHQPIQFTVMHFGSPTTMDVQLARAFEIEVFKVKNGLQVFEAWTEPAVAPKQVRIRVNLAKRLSIDTVLNIQPVIHRDIHLVHHSHTDIGYSHLQAEVETIQNNNIYKALELIDRTKDYPEDSRFVWNVESLWVVENFLGIASETDKQRFIAAVKGGSIALSANYANILTGLCTPEEMHWIVEYADSLRKWYGLPVSTAMQTDIPGMSWSMADAYAAHGIRYLSQGPNYIPDLPDGGDRIGSTLREQGDRPYWWKGTTGRDSILVWTAGQGYGGWHGFTPGAIKERGTRKIAAYMNELAAKGYPYDMVQWRYNIVSDNGPVDSTLSDFVRAWNEKYASPHLIIANVNDMMAEFEENYGEDIPTWSGDFTPYWEDGAYSTAKEEGEVRVLSARLSNLIDAAKILRKPIDPHLLSRAKRSIVMWHEHTWGAWNSISEPDDPDVIAQWNYKKAFADSAGWYVDEIERLVIPIAADPDTLCLINTLDWPRVGVPGFNTLCPTKRQRRKRFRESFHNLRNGITIRKDSSLQYLAAEITSDARPHFTIAPQWKSNQGIDSIYGGRDPASTSLPFHLWLSAFRVWGFSNGDTLEVGYCFNNPQWGLTYVLDKAMVRGKESQHLLLPFDIPNATVRIGISDTCVTPESGRIPGSNNDFFCVQRWIDVSNDSMGITIVCPQGALWEVGEMVDERKVVPGRGTNAEKYKAWKSEARSSSTIYLYALNNYWHTNFKADQEGPITFDIYLKMHGPFKLEDARRFGLEMTRPLITWWK